MNTPERIASFTVDHDFITPGIYISRIDGDVVTYDLRTRKPNMGDYMDNLTMHSVEHMIATYIRSSEIGSDVIYFGPMGCQTGFYLLVRDREPSAVLAALIGVLNSVIEHSDGMFGESRKECGNYKNLSVEAARLECREYLRVLTSKENDFKYPTE